MSKQGIIDLMTRRSQDRQECLEFKADPDAGMAGLDLTDEEKALLKRGQQEEIRDYLGGATSLCIWMTCEE